MTNLDGDPLAPPSAAGPWPAGHRAALCLTVDLGPTAGEDGPNERDPEADDPRPGAERLLRLLADTGVAATFTWSRPAIAADAGLIEHVRANGHELAVRIGANEQPDGLWRAGLLDARDALERIAGVEIAGFKADGPGPGQPIDEIGQELGFRWVMARSGGALPAAVQPDEARPAIVRLPASRWGDDRRLFIDHAPIARHAFEAWRDDLDTIRDEGGLLLLTLHPAVGGRPGPSRAVALLLDHAIDTGDLWITRADHLALWWAERHGPR